MENPQETPSSSKSSWDEVASELSALGNSLAKAFSALWTRVESSEEARQVKEGLESALQQVEQALKEAAETPEAQEVKLHARNTLEHLRTAGEQTVQEVQPQIVEGLQKLNEELEHLIEQLRQK
ncbi:hypothetical protein [Anaerolinea sp.]|uniref:hypothetical protein n=1 Tax=Anaerolinea sp. TaxID=1872519 RepID=UPI002ACEB09B|nr:hypothetical protein [Anaerolinea sp.]